ncbi:cytokinin riboside 5'-monophosphate phosphoribohydrolase [Bacteroidia bacterium]|nr:cytokinin riboside 5'-monophosphate phosphoribohydrolase [Bacteroidia bacterium]
MYIAVYCSSSDKIAEKYRKIAFELGTWIAANGHTLVYGGATGGLMDSVSDGALAGSGKIIGVIPHAVMRMGRIADKSMRLLVVQTMSERKMMMKSLADVFVVLPGGFGTLDEAFDIIASATVGEHHKPLILLNINNFYKNLVAQFDHCRTENCIPFEENYKPFIVNSLEECTTMLMSIYNSTV